MKDNKIKNFDNKFEIIKAQTQALINEYDVFNRNQLKSIINSNISDKYVLLEIFDELKKEYETQINNFKLKKITHKRSYEILKRIFFRTQYKAMLQYQSLFEEENYNTIILSLMNHIKIDNKISCTDQLYENVNKKYKKYNSFYSINVKNKSLDEEKFEAERNYNLNIKKKNIYATPFFQEKKRRNTFNSNRPKKKQTKNEKKNKKY